MISYYYLHENGDLINKPECPDPSDFVKRVWKIDNTERIDAWRIVIEACYYGANESRILELCNIWNINITDLASYMKRETDITPIKANGLNKLLELQGHDPLEVMNADYLNKVSRENEHDKEKPH